jgi:hypothetical protein
VLGLGGKGNSPGKLLYWSGLPDAPPLPGRTEVRARAWHHLALLRLGDLACVILDGERRPELVGPAGFLPQSGVIYVGGSPKNGSTLEGKIDEVAIYDRALGPDEIIDHFRLGGET